MLVFECAPWNDSDSNNSNGGRSRGWQLDLFGCMAMSGGIWGRAANLV